MSIQSDIEMLSIEALEYYAKIRPNNYAAEEAERAAKAQPAQV